MEKQFKVNQLSVQIYKDKFEMGKAAADLAEKHISDAFDKKGKSVIILATGASQFEFLDSLSEKKIDWAKVVAFHLDEYVGMDVSHPASFRRYLKERFIDKIGIGTFYPIKGDCEDLNRECQRLEDLLNKYTVDVAFVGIGENGHLAFNEPPANFNDRVKFKLVELDEASRKQQMDEGWFKTLEEVPKKAITMTIPAIMESKAIICTVPDARKARAVKNTLISKISPEFPASIIREHPNAALFLEQNSASLVD